MYEEIAPFRSDSYHQNQYMVSLKLLMLPLDYHLTDLGSDKWHYSCKIWNS